MLNILCTSASSTCQVHTQGRVPTRSQAMNSGELPWGETVWILSAMHMGYDPLDFSFVWKKYANQSSLLLWASGQVWNTGPEPWVWWNWVQVVNLKVSGMLLALESRAVKVPRLLRQCVVILTKALFCKPPTQLIRVPVALCTAPTSHLRRDSDCSPKGTKPSFKAPTLCQSRL